jgi:hypothetical protein
VLHRVLKGVTQSEKETEWNKIPALQKHPFFRVLRVFSVSSVKPFLMLDAGYWMLDTGHW